ncbi:hypothetical protein MC7420_2393 [Coleofasciculus chthonoplastes PCC 7420]|uniref:DUF1868 domain-containing protein n=1 Tax=Coleofasciculus chthonoplastes PCC 7420 TaxID=118168 RepID=B4W284_9CYAN|nr:DUF1868 domain-containing protein [Coleofasciculus chthonoplastes]EDX71727.1 hypothetical protein MC7420_2393 [Coleofasciculus chthonoplastes PCC 7420]
MDDTYPTYINRVVRMTVLDSYHSQLPNIQESPKFEHLADGTTKAVNFPGYTVMTPPWEDESENQAFYGSLQELQTILEGEFKSSLMISLPPESFHLTLADLIWENNYRDAVQNNPEFDPQLQGRIRESFGQYQELYRSSYPIYWQFFGVIVMPRAIGVCLVPKDEESYQRVVEFRRCIYQNPGLIGLGVEQQYHFTAHITLGYFGEIPAQLERDRISSMLSDLNQQWLAKEDNLFLVKRAELRKFDNMTHFYRKSDFPVVEF